MTRRIKYKTEIEKKIHKLDFMFKTHSLPHERHRRLITAAMFDCRVADEWNGKDCYGVHLGDEWATIEVIPYGDVSEHLHEVVIRRLSQPAIIK